MPRFANPADIDAAHSIAHAEFDNALQALFRAANKLETIARITGDCISQLQMHSAVADVGDEWAWHNENTERPITPLPIANLIDVQGYLYIESTGTRLYSSLQGNNGKAGMVESTQNVDAWQLALHRGIDAASPDEHLCNALLNAARSGELGDCTHARLPNGVIVAVGEY